MKLLFELIYVEYVHYADYSFAVLTSLCSLLHAYEIT